jgi:hypothetical protein
MATLVAFNAPTRLPPPPSTETLRALTLIKVAMVASRQGEPEKTLRTRN